MSIIEKDPADLRIRRANLQDDPKPLSISYFYEGSGPRDAS